MADAPSLKELERELYRREKPKAPPAPKKQPEPVFSPPEPPPFDEDRAGNLSRFGTRRFVWLLSAVIVVALGLSAFIFWRGFFAFTKNKVDLVISAPPEAVAGEQVTWSVKLQNNNRMALEEGELIFRFPSNSFNPETKELLTRKNVSIGTLEPGRSAQEDFEALVIGGDGFERPSEVIFRFKPAESNLTFEITKEHELVISSFPVAILPEGPAETLSGEKVIVSFKLNNESQQAFDNLRLRFEYPSGFKFQNSTEELDDFNRIWNLETMLATEEKRIELTGVLSGLEGEGKIFRAFLEYREGSRWQTYKEAALRSDLAVLPLSLDISLDRNESGAVSLNEKLNYKMVWRNNFDVPLENLVLIAKLTGGVFDFATLETEGEFSTDETSIRWSQAQLPTLKTLRPNEQGDVSFTIRTKKTFPAGSSNLVLGLDAMLTSETKPPGLTVEKVQVVKNHEVKLSGELKLTTSAFYNEPTSFFTNTGPYPMKVDRTTTFTIHWKLNSFASNFRDVRIKTALPSGVAWMGEAVAVDSVGDINYNSAAREVIWVIDNVRANSSALEAIFKIAVRPLPSQVDSIIPILAETELFTQDIFTGGKFETVNKLIKSDLPDDPAGSFQSGEVQP